MKVQRQHSRKTNDERQRRIVEHVLRHRISTNEAIRRHVCPNLTPNAVSKLTAKLCKRGVLASHPLFPPLVYFTLGKRAIADKGLPLKRTLPLGPQALPIEYGALAYAALGSGNHCRLTVPELKRLLPGATAVLLDVPYSLDENGTPTPVLELIRVDLGGSADHVARKCAADLRQRQREAAFQTWISQGRLRLVIVTGTPDKSAAIRSALDQHLWPDGLSIHFAVVPPLLRLTGRI